MERRKDRIFFQKHSLYGVYPTAISFFTQRGFADSAIFVYARFLFDYKGF